MIGMTTARRLLASGLLVMMPIGAQSQSGPPVASRGPASVQTQKTEEGQTVVYDAYTWQRRELDKLLPLDEPWPGEASIAAVFQRFGLDRLSLPDAIPVPARIMKDVYLVNSKSNHAYLIDGGPRGLILIDPGPAENVDAIRARVRELGFDPANIKWVINTHAHYDHSMADAAFQRLGAKILIGRADAPAVEKGTLVTAKYAVASARDGSYPTLKVDWPVDDGEELHLGNKTFYAIATPGHTPGSTCFLLVIDGKKILFGGDTILFDYRLGAQGQYADNVAYAASLRKLANFSVYPYGKISWDALLPGHGTLVLDRAYRDVLKGLRQVQLANANGAPVNALPFADDYYRKLMAGRPASSQ